MKRVFFLSVLIICGCSNDAQNKANFEACVLKAEEKYQKAFNEICIHQSWDQAGRCSYNISTNNALVHSKDNEITACATMYAPSKK